MLPGSGESLLAGPDLPARGHRCIEHVPTPNATHVVVIGRA